MKLLITLTMVPIILWGPETIEVHKDATSFSLEITHTQTPPPAGVITQQPVATVIDANSPGWSNLPLRERVRHVCINNKTTFIAAGATITASTVAGIIALIVHFTAA